MIAHFYLPFWLDLADSGGCAPLHEIKAELTKLGINARGWRLYVDYGDALLAPLQAHWLKNVSPERALRVAVSWLRLLQSCEMDVLPPPEMVASIPHWQLPVQDFDAIPVLFLRAVWKACVAAQYSQQGLLAFISKDLIPLAQWFFSSGSYKSTQSQVLKAGWSSLKRLRRESVVVEARKLSADDFPPVVQNYESGAYHMQALCTQAELTEEGALMQHCVGSYGNNCRFEPVRIFSVRHRKTGARVATLALREEKPGQWQINQLKGPKNAQVDDSVWREAFGLVLIINRVSTEDPKLRRFLDFVHSLDANVGDDDDEDGCF